MPLYPHQERAFDVLRAGKNVILQAPTGAGKTRAALYPFIKMSEFASYGFPSQCIYCVPMKVLANQFQQEYRDIIHDYNLKYNQSLQVTLQTGEDAGDPEFKGDLIFTTIDQALSRFLNYPYGVSKRKANVHAAAVMNAYLVFDEFHLLDPKSTLPTTLAMLRMLRGITPFMLMTATFSNEMLSNLASLLDAEVIPATAEEREAFQALPSQRKTRRYSVNTTALTPEAVLADGARRSIVICNTVSRATAMSDALRLLSPDTEVLLLHSRFLPEDRKAIQARLVQRFGKDADRQSGRVIAVATQSIEVGVDITSDRLHTELAPANAIIQRAGRCARYPGEYGEVMIYRYSLKDGAPLDLIENPNPYAGQNTILTKTWEAFSARDGQVFSFSDEQAVLTEAHSAQDRITLTGLAGGSFGHRQQMTDVMNGRYTLSNPTNLVRDVFQARVTLSDAPASLLDSPFDAPSFGLHPGTLQQAFVAMQAIEGERPFTMQYLTVIENETSAGDGETYRRTEYAWQTVRNGKEILGAALLVIHPSVARYDVQRGLVLGQPSDPDGWQASIPPRKADAERKQYTYKLETYAKHIELVYEVAFEAGGVWDGLEDLAKRLERRFGWETGSIRKAAELAVLLHDVGKLSVGWQTWIREYQAKIGLPTETGEVYAHTDSQTQQHRDIERSMKRRPPHAVESALAASPIYAAALGDDDHPLVKAVYSAIARHHAPFSDSNEAYRLVPDAKRHIAKTLPLDGLTWLEAGLIADCERDADPQCDNIAKPEDGEAYWAYLLLARLLRLSDQEGTRKGGL